MRRRWSTARRAASPSRRRRTCARRGAPRPAARCASLAPIRPVPRTQPMRGATSRVCAPQGSLRARRSSTSSAALVSPYGPSPPNAPWLGESGSRTVRGRPERADQPLDAEQLQAERGLEARAGLARVAGGGQRGERREQRGRERVQPQVVAALAAAAGRVRATRRARRCRRTRRGSRARRGARRRAGGRAVEVAVEAAPRGRVGRGGDDDGRAAPQQVPDELGRDRAGRGAGDERDLAAQVGEVLSGAEFGDERGRGVGGAVTGASGAPEARPRMRSRGRERRRRADDGAPSAAISTVGRAPRSGGRAVAGAAAAATRASVAATSGTLVPRLGGEVGAVAAMLGAWAARRSISAAARSRAGRRGRRGRR